MVLTKSIQAAKKAAKAAQELAGIATTTGLPVTNQEAPTGAQPVAKAPQGRPPIPAPRGPVDGELEDLTEQEAAQHRLDALVDLVASERQERLEESRWVWNRLDALHDMMVEMRGGLAARVEAAALFGGGEIGAGSSAGTVDGERRRGGDGRGGRGDGGGRANGGDGGSAGGEWRGRPGGRPGAFRPRHARSGWRAWSAAYTVGPGAGRPEREGQDARL
ncbi:unnamed protein product [Linum trigynum]|uniref:Uncharacterized protein n=1 Tax=Linum trigynum TaxID=586398 RepID=A0AAV2CS50_9ROSI